MAINFTQLDQTNNPIARPTHARTTINPNNISNVSHMSPHRPQTLNLNNDSSLLGTGPTDSNFTNFSNLNNLNTNNNNMPIRYPNLTQPAQRVPFSNVTNNIPNMSNMVNNNKFSQNNNNNNNNDLGGINGINGINSISNISPTQEENRIDRVMHEVVGESLKRKQRQNPRIPGRKNDSNYSKQMLNRLDRPLSPRQNSINSSSNNSNSMDGKGGGRGVGSRSFGDVNELNNNNNNRNNRMGNSRQGGGLFQSLRSGAGGYGNNNRNNNNNNITDDNDNDNNGSILPRNFKFSQPKRLADKIYMPGLNRVNEENTSNVDNIGNNNSNNNNNNGNEDERKSPERAGSRSRSVRSQSGVAGNNNNNNNNEEQNIRVNGKVGNGVNRLNELAITRVNDSEDNYGKVVNKCNISVFGFPVSDFNYIHEQFRVFGQIKECKINKNTMNIIYNNENEALRALDKNGTWIIHEHYEYMIGVQYNDLIEKKRNFNNNGNITFGYQRAVDYNQGQGVPVISRDDSFGTKMWHFLMSGW